MSSKIWIAAALAAGMAVAAQPALSQTRTVAGMSPARLERVTQVLDKYIADGVVAGAVSLVYRKGQVVHVAARGYQDLERKIPMKRDTIFSMASMTKPFAAASVMMLVEEGKLRLDEPVDRLLPELANRKVLKNPNGPLSQVVDSPRPITVRDLLTYRMGLGSMDYAGIANDAPIARAFAATQGGGPVTQDEYMKRLGSLPLAYAPGEHFMYNTPSMLMGVLVSRASGMPYDQFLEARIYRPLGMKDTGYVVPPEKRSRFAFQYQPGPQPGTLAPINGNATRNSTPPLMPSGAGGQVSTVDDYLKFARMMLNGGELDGVRLLSRRSVELMTQDYMSEEQHGHMFVTPDFFSQAGFGFGLEVKTIQSNLGPSVGSYWWNGASGVSWTADPKEDLIYLRFIQRASGPASFGEDFATAVYQAIVD